MVNINKISTEERNQETLEIDVVSTFEMVKLINDQDKKVALAVEKVLPTIAKAIDAGVSAIKSGGRIIYFGAGTSGRLGILDASEILPTFGEEELFIGLIAGGKKAIQTPVENAEDSKDAIVTDFKNESITKNDLLIGIAASGRTPYVISGLEYAKKIGAMSVSISTSGNTKISEITDIPIEAIVGSETITGSTRMKSGTAQKMILNMISSGIMIKLGKTYSNLMVDLKPTNAKLISRAINMIKTICDIDHESAENLFNDSGKNVKIAIVMHYLKFSKENAIKELSKNDESLRKTINQ